MKQLMWKMNNARNVFGQVTVKFLNIRTHEKKNAVIILEFLQCGSTIELCVQKMQTEWQTVSDLGLHCLPRPICLKIQEHYSNLEYCQLGLFKYQTGRGDES